MLRKYRVTGKLRVLQHEPGTVFEADFPRDQEKRLTAAGHLAAVKEVKKNGEDHS